MFLFHYQLFKSGAAFTLGLQDVFHLLEYATIQFFVFHKEIPVAFKLIIRNLLN